MVIETLKNMKSPEPGIILELVKYGPQKLYGMMRNIFQAPYIARNLRTT